MRVVIKGGFSQHTGVGNRRGDEVIGRREMWTNRLRQSWKWRGDTYFNKRKEHQVTKGQTKVHNCRLCSAA